MKILILGATGRTGRLALDYALSKGHEVVALARDPAKIKASSPALTIVQGTPENPQDVAAAIKGCEAVVVALGITLASESPWAKPISPPHLMETSVRNAVLGMQGNNIRRIVIVAADGAGDSYANVSWVIRLMINRTSIGVGYRDHDGVDAFIRQTDTDWTIMRPVRLTNSDKQKQLIVSYANQPKPASSISRGHVAKFTIDSLGDQALYGKAPTISESR